MFNTVNELLPVSSVILIAQHLKVSFCLAYQDFPHTYIYTHLSLMDLVVCSRSSLEFQSFSARWLFWSVLCLCFQVEGGGGGAREG